MLRLLYVTVLVSWLLLGAVESFLLPQKAVVATRTPQQHHYSLLVLKTTTTTTTISEEEDATTNNTPKALGAWVPVGSASNLKGLDPTRIEIMGRFLVVWQNSDSDTIKWNVAMDECPHRMAPLSQGRINPQTNCLECPYHGWQFHGNGTLACIPQEEEARRPIITKNHNSNFGRLESFPTHSTGDLIWAFLPTTWHGESFPISLLPEDYYQGLAATKKSLFDVVNLPYSWEFLVENGLDGPHHATFAHHGVGFDRAEVTPLTFQVPINNATHLAVEVKYQRKGLERHRRYGVQRPFLVTNQQLVDGGEWEPAIMFFAVPIREGFCRLITTLDTLAPHPKTPQWILHWINRKFFEGDIWMHETEWNLRKLRKRDTMPKYIYATSSDDSVKAFRSWWTANRLDQAPPHSFGPASPENLLLLSRSEQVDPWRLHTQHCSQCRAVVRRAQVCRRLGLGLGLAGLGGCAVIRNNHRWVSVFVTVAALLGGALLHWGSNRVLREVAGGASSSSSASQVGDRSLSHTD